MAAATATMPIGLEPKTTLPSDIPVEPLKQQEIVTLPELFKSKVRDTPNLVFLRAPATAKGKSDYVEYTVGEINRLADEAARQYQKQGLHPEPKDGKSEIISVLGASTIEYVITMMALSRMGFGLLLLSTRLSPEGYANLLRLTDCKKMVAGQAYLARAAEVQQQSPLAIFNLTTKADYELEQPSGPPITYTRPINAGQQIAFIIHSSGSTGLPKPIYQTHSACVANYSSGIPYRAFMTLPMYHNHGLSVLHRALIAGKAISLYNANLPLSGPTLIDCMRVTQPESLHCVPYALKLMAETEGGIEELKKVKMVMFGGSSCPDELGDRLTEAGVYLVGQYGTTETGQLMLSFRDHPNDKAWNYLRPLPTTKDYIRMVPRGANIFECMVVDGLPSKTTSNSDDPPNSYYTRDTFIPHPAIPDAWKYLGRLDDRVTLINGEKVLPIPYEHCIRQHELVKEAVVFGVGKAVPGLMVVPSDSAISLSKSEILQAILPQIELANSKAEEFGRISPEMVEFLDVGTEYPRTDKDSVIRAAFTRQFSQQIDAVYERFEAPQLQDGATLRQLEHEELVEYLLDLFRSKLGDSELQTTTDFFEGGIDSRQAITARSQILREIDVGGYSVGSNVIFEYPNVELLARYLYALRTGTPVAEEDEISVMRELIAKYSDFQPREAGSLSPTGEVALLTGVTGSLGAHMLAKALRTTKVEHVYCLVRAPTQDAAKARVISTLEAKGIPPLQKEELSRVTIVPADLSQESLGLDAETTEKLSRRLTVVIHSAWAVNFNLGVRSFESQHIRGAYNLINLCLRAQTRRPARFYFCSSISAAAGTPLPATIEECHIKDLSHAQDMGYARSKLVTEHIVQAASEKTGMVASVLRIGQIVGDTGNGLWNTTEAIPLMLQTAKTLGALPALEETPSWMPVDLVAKAAIDIAAVGDRQDSDGLTPGVYHVQNTRLFHWTKDLLPALKEAGLNFRTVSQREWVSILRQSDQDPEKNPTIKLLDFFEEKYDNDRPGRSGLTFITNKAEAESQTMKEAFDIIRSGLVSKMTQWWDTQW